MGSFGIRNGDEWIGTNATVVSSRKRLLPLRAAAEGVYPLPEYVVTFTYTAGSRVLTGKYVTSSATAPGHSFDIFYDPEHPLRNTGLDEPINPYVKWVAGVLGVTVALLALWFRGDSAWFQN